MRRRRNAYTLLELLLAMAIAVLVLGSVYSFIGYQLRQASAGRDVVERATLARAILQRVDTDVRAIVALNDPGRFRMSSSSSGGSGSSGGGGSSTGSGSTSSSPAASTPAAGSSASTSGSSSTSSSSTSSSSSSSSSSSTSGSGLPGPIELPLGVIGSSTGMHLFISRVPTDVLPTAAGNPGVVTSDLRRITYWVSEGGLYRMEIPLATSDQAGDTEIPTGDKEPYLFASEVRSVEFSYYDGTSWNDSWDSTTTGPDSTTPQGSPRAIAIKIGIEQPGKNGKPGKVKQYRHVVPIVTANGTPLNLNSEGGVTPP